jgi:hypothetical protein
MSTRSAGSSEGAQAKTDIASNNIEKRFITTSGVRVHPTEFLILNFEF